MSKSVLITGGAKRVGRLTAQRFSREGWHVIIHYNRSKAEAALLADNIIAGGGSASTIQFDLKDRASVLAGAAQAYKERPDWVLLINNASVFEYDNADEPDVDVWDESLAVNCLSPVLLAAEFVRLTQSAQERCVINLLDQKIENLNPDYFSYTIAKSGLDTASKMMAMAYARHGVRVCNVAPGLALPSGDQTQEEFEQSSKMNLLGHTTEVDEIIDGIYFLATSSVSTGQTLFVDSGQRLTPHERDVMFLVRGE